MTDRELGRLIDAYAPDTVFVVSDHGGGPTTDWVLFLNDWLADAGLLRIVPKATASIRRRLYGQAKKRLPVPVRRRLRSLKVLDKAKEAGLYGDFDWTRTKAYAQMEPAFRINLSGREPAGSVPADRADEVVSEVIERASALRLPDGTRAFTVHRASDVYAGDAPGGPDIVMEPAPGLHIRSRNTAGSSGYVARLSDLGMYLPSGVHTPVGMVVAAGAGIEARGRVEESDIHQVTPSVLAVMGVPAPTLDAEPFSFVTSRLVRTGEDVATAPARGSDLDAAEEEEVLERLRGLGYVD